MKWVHWDYKTRNQNMKTKLEKGEKEKKKEASKKECKLQ